MYGCEKEARWKNMRFGQRAYLYHGASPATPTHYCGGRLIFVGQMAEMLNGYHLKTVAAGKTIILRQNRGDLVWRVKRRGFWGLQTLADALLDKNGFRARL
jgi:hypothetical protein